MTDYQVSIKVVVDEKRKRDVKWNIGGGEAVGDSISSIWESFIGLAGKWTSTSQICLYTKARNRLKALIANVWNRDDTDEAIVCPVFNVLVLDFLLRNVWRKKTNTLISLLFFLNIKLLKTLFFKLCDVSIILNYNLHLSLSVQL